MQLKAGVTYVAPAFLRKFPVYGDNGSPTGEAMTTRPTKFDGWKGFGGDNALQAMPGCFCLCQTLKKILTVPGNSTIINKYMETFT